MVIIIPYASLSAGYLTFDPGDTNGNQLPGNYLNLYEKSSLLYTGELGIKFPFSSKWSLNLGFNYNFAGTDYLDDIKVGPNNDSFLSIFTGVSLLLGGTNDVDNDGISDDIDLCLDTPQGIEVDEFGCNISPKKYENYVYDTSNDKFISDGIFSDGRLICLQLDIFQELKKAIALQQKVNSLGYSAFIFNIQSGNSIFYSVRIGYFETVEEARIFKELFFKKTGIRLNE